jgi:hypothetical protein
MGSPAESYIETLKTLTRCPGQCAGRAFTGESHHIILFGAVIFSYRISCKNHTPGQQHLRRKATHIRNTISSIRSDERQRWDLAA